MKVKVTKENVVITEHSRVNEGEYKVNKCEFLLPQCFDGLTVTAAFDNIPVPLFGNECFIPSLKKGTSVLGVYAYKETEEGLQLMYSPKPTMFYVDCGSYSDDIGAEETPELSLFEKYCKDISEMAIPKTDILENFDIDVSVSDGQIYSAEAILGFAEIIGNEMSIDRDEITSLKNQYGQFTNEVNERVEATESKVSVLGNSLKGNKSDKGSLRITDVSPVNHPIDIELSSDVISDIANTSVTVHGKNLFGFEGRQVKSFEDNSSSASRDFNGDGIYLGVTGSNIYSPTNVSYEYDSNNNEIILNCKSAWYGVGVDIPVEPDDIYSVSMISPHTNARIVCSFYTAEGEHLSFVQGTNYKVTVPSGASWMLYIIASSQVANSVDFKNVQVEKGSSATEFCKYVHPQKLISDTNGKISGAESIYPVTILEADDENINISVEYNRDINVAFNELREAIIGLGGVL